ncbi:MFS transporter [Ligilactobacillus animalis]|uniref:MFS transporter n=1 Tax=Ligilactobacillus animalis TaxID=1605 RepID=UPI0008271C38|nr:MFS transporter [Ligilactobacillus animalis]OCX49024.1 multidrug transporter [Ligilactobacillus animalis]QHQ69303.1 MFS transporter [Ligilactobacillus animalis]WKB72751.1 MFS transporter [Ligilactobacillus animalis]
MDNISKTIDPKIRLIVTILLLFSGFVSLASQTMMITALPVIEHEMNVSLTLVQWLTTGYTLMIGVITPLSSNLYEKFKKRNIFLTTIAIFILGTLIGCFATDFWILLLARLVQACASGILMSFQMTTMISIYPLEKRGTILGMSGLVIAFGPAIGPTLSGLIVNTLGWRYIFILVLPMMILVWLIGFFAFPNFSEPKDIKIDFASVGLSLLGSGLTLASLTFFQTSALQGWIMLVLGLAILFVFVKRQLRLKQPMLKVQLVKNRSFRLMTLVGICAFMVLLGTEQMLPIFTQNVLHLNSMVSGMILLPGAIANALSAAIVGRLYDKHGPKYLIISGGILMLIAAIPFVMISETTPVWLLTVAYMLRMIGNALVFSPAMSEAFVDVRPDEVSHATALNNSLRQAFGASSITILIVLSNIPATFTAGMRLSMWITVSLVLLMLICFSLYLHQNSRKD